MLDLKELSCIKEKYIEGKKQNENYRMLYEKRILLLQIHLGELMYWE
ncbi:MAG: hypothetical protein RR986_07870 [Longicatena sp.]